jgi:endonuclease YncB( thermonuclease family)
VRAHHRFRRRGAGIAGILAIAALMLADQRGWLLVKHADDLAAYHGRRARVTRVIDGDTLEIALSDALNQRQATRARLWGIDAPEPANGNKPAAPLATEATEQLSRLAALGEVTLWIEPHQTRDTFGAVLVYVDAADGTKINEAMLEHGLARIDERLPHSRLTRFAQVQGTAKRQGIGMWAMRTPAEGEPLPPPASR